MAPTDPSFLSDRVYEGVWRRYGQNNSSELILTLPIYKALIILAILVLAIEYGGSRAWVIVRFAISKSVWKPVQLEDQLPDRLLNISRGRAVMNTFVWNERPVNWLRRKMRSGILQESHINEHYDPGQSAWYGIAALANITAFVVLGIALPVILTEGTFEPPVVRSRPLSDCLVYNDATSPYQSFIGYAAALSKTDSITTLCRDALENCFRAMASCFLR
jgi:hypothetical protein